MRTCHSTCIQYDLPRINILVIFYSAWYRVVTAACVLPMQYNFVIIPIVIARLTKEITAYVPITI